MLVHQIDFSDEKRKESEEISEAERIAKDAERKPLWEQLAMKRDEEKAKFDAVRAAMFGEDCLINYYSTHTSRMRWIHTCSIGRLVRWNRVVWLCAN